MTRKKRVSRAFGELRRELGHAAATVALRGFRKWDFDVIRASGLDVRVVGCGCGNLTCARTEIYFPSGREFSFADLV
jgi:hypothetical protein